MNAGKSTMLNALIGKEILGSSVVPETANLNIIKYGQEEASVHYWNKKEWDKILHSATLLSSMNDFVKETYEAFDNNLDTYINTSSRVDSIDISHLSQYTSAKKSGKKCNL